MRRESTTNRISNRVMKLVNTFDYYCEFFDKNHQFTGPSIYFHQKAISMHRNLQPVQIIDEDLFLEYLYATLASWGLHRMGPGNTKLVEMDVFKDSIRQQHTNIEFLQSFEIGKLSNESIHLVLPRLWGIIAALKVGIGETKIVSGSKALHHILPNLIPPIDGEYTLRFFYNNRGTGLNQGDENAFFEMYPFFNKIAQECQDNIAKHLGSGMNTSKSKIIDNAIVGYCLKELL